MLSTAEEPSGASPTAPPAKALANDASPSSSASVASPSTASAAGAGAGAASSADPARPFAHLKLRCCDEDRERIAVLRSKVANSLAKASPWWASDAMMLRFLHSRSTIEEAESFYNDVIAWRAEVGADTMLETYTEPEVMRNYFPTGYHGVDREGYVILVERFGCIDLKGMREAIGEDDFLRWVIYYHERQEQQLQQQSLRLGEFRPSMTVIVDMQGLGLRMMSPSVVSLTQKRTALEEGHYPEVCRIVNLVRCPAVMTTAYNMVKGFLAEGTRNKMRIYGKDYMEPLSKIIAPEHIPRFLGGSCSCADAECSALICPGGTVPQALRVGLSADAEKLEVKSGNKVHVDVLVPEAHTLAWEFKVVGKDVDFHAFVAEETATAAATPPGRRQSVTSKSKTVLPSSTTVITQASRVSEHAGSWTSVQDRIVRLVWDNTFSWTRSKTVLHTVNVHPPASTSTDDAADAPAAGAGAGAGGGAAAAGADAVPPSPPAATDESTP